MTRPPGSAAAKAEPAIQQAAEDACTAMQAALAALKDSRDASCPLPSRQAIQAAVQQLEVEVAKTGLLYNRDGTAPTEAEASALLVSFSRAAAMLCMLYTGLSVHGSGPTLRTSLHQTATAVVEACAALIRGAVLGGARDAQLMMLSGFALEMLQAAARAPLDARTAIGRAIMQVLKQLADAQRELREAIAEAEAAAAAAGECDSSSAAECTSVAGGAAESGDAAGVANASSAGEDEDSDAGWGLLHEPFTAAQLEVARRAHAVLGAAVGVGRAVVRLLLAEGEDLSEEGVEGWESMLYHVRTLGPLCDDLAAAAYPPQDEAELASASEALATSCQLLLEECPGPDAAAACATRSAPEAAQPDSAAGGEGAGGATAAAHARAAAAGAERRAGDAGAAALRAAVAAVEAAQQQLLQQLGSGDGEA